MFERGFKGISGLPNFFSKTKTIHSGEMIAKKRANTFIDDVIPQVRKRYVDKLKSCLQCLRSSGLKTARNKTKLLFRKIKLLGHKV